MIPEFPKFKGLEITDKDTVETQVKKFPPYSDFNFISLISYDTKEKFEISMLNGNLVVKLLDYMTLEPVLSILGVNKISESLHTLIKYTKEVGINTTLKLVPEATIATEKEALIKDFDIEEDIDSFDYVFKTEDLISSKNHNKARYSKKFSTSFLSHVFKKIDLTDKVIQNSILELLEIWKKQKGKSNSEVENETIAIKRLLKFSPMLFLYSYGVFIEDRLIGFTINEIVQDSYYLGHFGKADLFYTGLSHYLEIQTAKELHKMGCTLLNLEQDLGISGLKSSKKSMHPYMYLKKYNIKELFS